MPAAAECGVSGRAPQSLNCPRRKRDAPHRQGESLGKYFTTISLERCDSIALRRVTCHVNGF